MANNSGSMSRYGKICLNYHIKIYTKQGELVNPIKYGATLDLVLLGIDEGNPFTFDDIGTIGWNHGITVTLAGNSLSLQNYISRLKEHDKKPPVGMFTKTIELLENTACIVVTKMPYLIQRPRHF